jgi:hypothetical protein
MASKRLIAPCALCLLNKPLVQSHIISGFLLRAAEDWIPTGKSGQEQPYLTLVDHQTTKQVYSSQRGNALKELELKEYLLCEACERVIQEGEDYAIECLYGSAPIKSHTRPAKSIRYYTMRRGMVLRGGYDNRWVDYPKFKLFQIGLIWRACVSKGKVYAAVDASDHDKERMRQALLNRKFNEDLSPCVMELLEGTDGPNVDMVAIPVAMDGNVQFIMGGYKWHFYLDGNAPTAFILRKSGFLRVGVSDIERFRTPDEMLRSPGPTPET